MSTRDASSDLEAAMTAFRRGDDAAALRDATAALRGSDPATAVQASCVLARIALRSGDPVAAARHATRAAEAADAAEGSGDRALLQLPLHLAAAIARLGGDLLAARALYKRSIALNRVLGVAGAVAAEERNLAYVEWHLGDPAGAADLLMRSHRVAGPHAVPERTMDRALLAIIDGDGAEAHRLLDAAQAAYAADGRVPDPDDEQELLQLRAALDGTR